MTAIRLLLFGRKEKLMKRIFALSLCLVLALSLACGTKEKPETVEPASAQPSGQAEETAEAASDTSRAAEESASDTVVTTIDPEPEKTTAAKKETPAPEPTAEEETREETPASEPASTPEPTEKPASEPEPTPASAPEPEPAPERTVVVPDLSELPIEVNSYLQFGEYPMEGHLFTFDLDYDGTPEDISFKADYQEGTITVLAENRSIVIERAAGEFSFILIDLDPETPYANVIAVIDGFTFVLHPEEDQLVDRVSSGIVYCDDGVLYRDESFLLLGARSGFCVCSGEDLAPEGDWWQDDYIPTEDEIEDEFDYLADASILLQVIRDLPCWIDEEETVLPKGTYLYVLGIDPVAKSVKVATTDGVEAIIVFTGDDDLGYSINDIPQEQYFKALPSEAN